MFPFITAYITNIYLIIGAILGLYFLALSTSLNNYHDLNKKKIIFNSKTDQLILSTKTKVLLGFFIGIFCFYISKNEIPIPIGIATDIDLQYLPIFFAVVYASPLTGVIGTFLLLFLRFLEYLTTSQSLASFGHDIPLILIILALSLIANKKPVNYQKTSYLFLGYSLLARFFIFTFTSYPIWDLTKTINMTIHFVVFTSGFLLASYIINKLIDVFQSLQFYRTSATYDSLTTTYNKESFLFFLDHAYNDALLDQRPFSLAIIDIDDFKQINDQYGHLTGDEILSETAQLIKKQLNSQNLLLFRIGGDEFAIIDRKKGHSKKNLATQAQRIIQLLEKKFSQQINKQLE